MIKVNIGRFKFLNVFMILFICLVLCSCKDKKPAVIPPGGGDENDIYRDVYYKYDTYEEMILGSEVCERKRYSYQFNFQLGGVEEYSYYLMARKKGGKKTEDEEITSDVLIERYAIIGRLDEKRKFSIIFGVFGLKESMEERLQGSIVWESDPLYDVYEDKTRYCLRNTTQNLFASCNIVFEGIFEEEFIQQILVSIYESIISQRVE